MEAKFWHSRWKNQEIGFHEGAVNRHLEAHFHVLHLKAGNTVLLPLCGKTRDIAWLLEKQMQVVGVELSALAVEQLFAELQLTPNITRQGELTRYTAEGVRVWVGDIFTLTPAHLEHIDAVYDRAALVALPGDMRQRYAEHLAHISAHAPQLLISFDYDQAKLDGPPFAVIGSEIEELYGSHYRIQPLAEKAIDGGLKGKVAAKETVWLLQ